MSIIKKISITGGIGSGKSTVMDLLRQQGYYVWDADVLAHEAMKQQEVESEIKDLLGAESYLSPGHLNREFVRNKVFNNPKLRKDLEDILHPRIQKLFENKLNMLQSDNISGWVFYEASLIFEKNLQDRFDINVLVTANDNTRIQRVKNAKKLSDDLISQIMSQQMPTEQKKQFADFIIENNGSLEDLKQKVNELTQYLKQKL